MKQFIITLDGDCDLTAEEIHTLLTQDLEDEYQPSDVTVKEVEG